MMVTPESSGFSRPDAMVASCVEKHSTGPKDLNKQFSVLKKCNDKFKWLVHEILLIRELTPSLN